MDGWYLVDHEKEGEPSPTIAEHTGAAQEVVHSCDPPLESPRSPIHPLSHLTVHMKSLHIYI